MATFVITNVTSPGAEVHLGSFYKTLAAGEVITLENRDVNEPAGWPDVQEALADGNITVVMTPTADELASGMMAPQQSVEAVDLAPVAAADIAAAEQCFYKPFVATGAAADDVTIYAVNTLPYKFRILEAIVVIATAAGTAIDLRDEAGGAGTDLGGFDPSGTGKKDSDEYTAPVVTPAATKGLFLRRDNGNSVGYALIRVRRES